MRHGGIATVVVSALTIPRAVDEVFVVRNLPVLCKWRSLSTIRSL
jgi:hypothetical protein